MADQERLIYGLAEHHYADFAHIFKRYPKIERVLIFGSRAKGTAKPYSDFDLAIMAPEMRDQEFNLLWNELDEVPLVFKFDILHWDTLVNQPLKEKILQEGRIFYP